MPSFRVMTNVMFGVPGKQHIFGGGAGRDLKPTSVGTGAYAITGVSRDAQGNPLGGATCLLFATGTDKLAGKVVSEAGTGAFSFTVPNTTTRYYITFLSADGSLGGTTVNTITGS